MEKYALILMMAEMKFIPYSGLHVEVSSLFCRSPHYSANYRLQVRLNPSSSIQDYQQLIRVQELALRNVVCNKGRNESRIDHIIQNPPILKDSCELNGLLNIK